MYGVILFKPISHNHQHYALIESQSSTTQAIHPAHYTNSQEQNRPSGNFPSAYIPASRKTNRRQSRARAAVHESAHYSRYEIEPRSCARSARRWKLSNSDARSLMRRCARALARDQAWKCTAGDSSRPRTASCLIPHTTTTTTRIPLFSISAASPVLFRSFFFFFFSFRSLSRVLGRRK